MSPQRQVIVIGGFDDIRARQIRFLEEAAKFGELTVLLWPDETLAHRTGRAPKFPLAERLYLVSAVRHVHRAVATVAPADPFGLPELGGRPGVWVDEEADANAARRDYCLRHGIEYRVLAPSQLAGFPEPPPMPSAPGRRKVVATGCFDWFHSGHVRFAEEAATYGDLYVIVGHDANVRMLKGEGHPMISQEERRYAVGSIRHVKQALISSGDGWLDADPEIRRLKPDIYVVNEDGDQGGKGEYCQKLGIEYLVLKRAPAPGLPERRSTDLRGF
jgi:cytidyltransferase-like protein